MDRDPPGAGGGPAGVPGGGPADGSDRSAPAPDLSARDWTRTRTSDATEPPPGADVAVVEAVRLESQVEAERLEAGQAPAGPDVSYTGAPTGAVRTAGAPARAHLLVQGLLPALVAGALAVAGWAGPSPLLVVVLVLQVALVLALLGVLAAPAAAGAAVVAVTAAVVADALVLVDDGAVDRVAGVLGLSLVAALLHQLVRRSRNRVTESLADTMLAVVVAGGASCLLAVAVLDGGLEVLLVGLYAAASVVLVGRLVDLVLPRPVLTTGATRGWPGLVAGVLAGVGTAAVSGSYAAGVSPAAAALLGLAAAVTVATADLALDLAAAELRPGRRDARRATALRPAAALLPFAALGPVVLLAGRLVLS